MINVNGATFEDIDLEQLTKLLQKMKGNNIIIFSECVFGMNGRIKTRDSIDHSNKR